MEEDGRGSSVAAAKRHPNTLQSLFDACLGLEEIDGAMESDEDCRAEFLCPFCSEEFDVIGLCCHIDDEHPGESKDGVCPICATRVGMDMVDHIAFQHGSYFKMSHGKLHKDFSDYQSMFSMLRKDRSDGSLQSFIRDSSFRIAPSNAAPDPLLSFIISLPMADLLEDMRIESSDKHIADNLSDEMMVQSAEPSSSCEDTERDWRRNFVQELVLSTVFQDTL